jgi:hypothetical protein
MSDQSKALDVIEQLQAEARQQGIDELGRAIFDVLERFGIWSKPKPYKSVVHRESKSPRGRPRIKRTKRKSLRPGTDMERVFTAIQKHPGNKGFQIQALLAQSGTVIHERTMRTCLNRLKSRGYIEQRGDEKAWFPKEEQKA